MSITVRMAEGSKAPDSRLRNVFWSTNVGVGSNPTNDIVSFPISKININVSFAYFPYLRLITKEKSGHISITIRMLEWSEAPDTILRNFALLQLCILVC